MTDCLSCGQPVPLNGPVRNMTCTSCFGTVEIPEDIYTDFFRDFEEAYEGLEDGQGQEVTVMSGGGTYKFACYRLAPRCRECGSLLREVTDGTDGSISCGECGREHETFPVPEWLKREVPTAVQCCNADREENRTVAKALPVNNKSAKPVAMNCPQCGGGLLITGASERISKCNYCQVDVFIPDPVWLRLHPVKTAREWYLSFEGETLPEAREKMRAGDLEEETKALKCLKPGAASNNPAGRLIKLGLKAGAGIILLLILVTGTLMLFRFSSPEIGDIVSKIIAVIAIALFAALTIYGALHLEIAYRFMGAGRCKRAMSALADKFKWKHQGREYKNTMGSITARIKGREFRLEPDDHHALKVDIAHSPFHISTDPPGFPGEDLKRFTTGDERFDGFFPIRYAEQKISEAMEKKGDLKNLIISSFYWFLDRWEAKIGKMQVDWSGIQIHLLPGHEESFINPVRYLNPEDIEPLIQDAMVFAAALEAAVKGKTPLLP